MFYSRVEVVVGDGAKAGQKNGSGSTQKPWLRQPWKNVGSESVNNFVYEVILYDIVCR